MVECREMTRQIIMHDKFLTSYRSSLACSSSKRDSEGDSAMVDTGVMGCRLSTSELLSLSRSRSRSRSSCMCDRIRKRGTGQEEEVSVRDEI